MKHDNIYSFINALHGCLLPYFSGQSPIINFSIHGDNGDEIVEIFIHQSIDLKQIDRFIYHEGEFVFNIALELENSTPTLKSNIKRLIKKVQKQHWGNQ